LTIESAPRRNGVDGRYISKESAKEFLGSRAVEDCGFAEWIRGVSAISRSRARPGFIDNLVDA
jgi:hypothetical protein